MSDFKSPREIELELKVLSLEQKVADLERQLTEQLSLNEPARKKPALSAIVIDKIAYVYHFYDHASELFVYHGFSEVHGARTREYDHVNDSKKPGVTGKLKEINRLMKESGTGLQVFRSKIRLTRDEAKNYEACILLAEDQSTNTRAGSFCGEFLTYSEEQKRAFGIKLIGEARACIPLNPKIYTYENFKNYKPESVGRVGDCKGSCGRKGIELYAAGYCKDCQTEYSEKIKPTGICEGKVKDENGKTLFSGCKKNKPLKNQRDKFCMPCNKIALTWKNRAVCQGPDGNGCTNSASKDKSAIVRIFQKTPQKMCNACLAAYGRANKKPEKAGK